MTPANGAGQQTKPATGTTVEGKPAKKRDPKWTVMVFMGADFIEGNVDLDQAATDDLEEIESIGASETLEIFVQIHRRGGVVNRHRFWWTGVEKQPNGPADDRSDLRSAHSSSSSTGRSKKLTTAGTTYSLLVLWGHAYDFAFGRSRSRTGVIDGIDFIELRGLLQRLQDVVHDRYRRDTATSTPHGRLSTSWRSMRATPRPWSWRVSCRSSPPICWDPRSASRFQDGPTTGYAGSPNRWGNS